MQNENLPAKRQTNSMIITICFLVFATLLVFFLFDIFNIGYESVSCCGYFEFSYDVVPFDVLIQLVSLAASIALPSAEQRVWAKYSISEDEFLTLSGDDKKSLYTTMLVIVCLLLVLDAVFYIFNLSWSLNAVFICGLILIVFFVLPCLIITISYEGHFIEIVADQYHNYILGDSKYKRLSTNPTYIDEVKRIISNVVFSMTIKYGAEKTLHLLNKHYKGE